MPMIDLCDSRVITRELMTDILENFRIPNTAFHGPDHWARVRNNGLLLAPHTGADPVVVMLFSVIHDSQRWDDGSDMEHGPRAAEYAIQNHGRLFSATRAQLDALVEACMGHTTGLHVANQTVQTCWDSDRLDIGRVGYEINTHYLGTIAARQPTMIAYATSASDGRPDRSFAQIKKDLAEAMAPTAMSHSLPRGNRRPRL